MEIIARTIVNSEALAQTEIDGHVVITEAPVQAGGSGKYPPATRLFIASLLNCTMSGLQAFFETRDLLTEGLAIDFSGEMEKGVYKTIHLEVTLPEGFPEKYLAAVNKTIESCSVKRTILNMPTIETEIKRS